MRITIIIMTLLTLLATACGGDDVADTAATDAETSADTTEETEAEAATDAEPTADASAEAGADASADVAGLSENCAAITQAFTSVPQALAGGAADAGAVRAEADAFAEVAADVPEEYAADFQLFADYFSQIADAVESGDPAQLSELGTTASSADFQTASTNLATFFGNGCQ